MFNGVHVSFGTANSRESLRCLTFGRCGIELYQQLSLLDVIALFHQDSFDHGASRGMRLKIINRLNFSVS